MLKSARFLHLETLKDIMIPCIILHNIIVEDERHLYLCADDFDYKQFDGIQPGPISHHRTPQLIEFIQRHQSIRDRGSHSKLQADLVEHIWQVIRTCNL